MWLRPLPAPPSLLAAMSAADLGWFQAVRQLMDPACSLSWPLSLAFTAALSAADRGGFKTVRQLMDPVIEEMQEAAAGEDDGMLIKAVGVVLYQLLLMERWRNAG